LEQRSTETPSGIEAAQYARRFRGMWPQGNVHSEEGYLAGIAQFFTALPRWQVDAICNPTGGFMSIHKFPPSIAEIHEWTKPPEKPENKFLPKYEYNPGPNFTQERLRREEKSEVDRFNKPGNEEYRRKVVANAMAGGEPLDPIAREKFREWKAGRETYRPFPKLWEAFSDDREFIAWLESGLTFDRLFSLSRTLATQGKEAARALRRQSRSDLAFIPPMPNVDISDFPDGPKTVTSWKDVPAAATPSDVPAWRDKEELRKSRDRIAQAMGSDEYLWTDD
jgi:hypothetical protein